ncbi:hypothetical protein SAMN05216349_12364 [Oribacterium sp. KHPX15]|uniref:hypothetical protein n=1 Tax=Oribacterium sp. KHPX15 TaxID=1855342 RepID=UPI00089945B8|nr:hypothetical protein [Oribacterium sp. KHPX15]SEA70500.1 hypothetical protein SAMN05216349_12364 [Oribacterium sp. KHPX15]
MHKKSETKIEELLNDNPKSIMVLYRMLKTDNFNLFQEGDKLCDYLLNNKNLLSQIPTELTYAGEDLRTERGWKDKEYRIDTRDGYPVGLKERQKLDDTPIDSLSEDLLAMHFFKQGRSKKEIKNPDKIENLGYILDYQMPIGGTLSLLKVSSNDKYNKSDKSYPFGIRNPLNNDHLFSPGKCDLISYDNNQFTILELKIKDSPEPLIRAVLEVYTYYQMLNKEKVTENLREYYPNLNIPDYKKVKWRKSPLLYKGEDQKQFIEYANPSSNLRKLTKELDIEPIWYRFENNKVVIG